MDTATTALDTTILGHIERARSADPAGEYRKRIADLANAETMWSALTEMVASEVAGLQWVRVGNVISAGHVPHKALALVLESAIDTILRGADDQWSGRGNDLRRVKHDALCQWADGARLLLQSYEVGS
jgi:hypothetical protein